MKRSSAISVCAMLLTVCCGAASVSADTIRQDRLFMHAISTNSEWFGGWNYNLFDPTLGTLNSIHLDFFGAINQQIEAANFALVSSNLYGATSVQQVSILNDALGTKSYLDMAGSVLSVGSHTLLPGTIAPDLHQPVQLQRQSPEPGQSSWLPPVHASAASTEENDLPSNRRL